jgi:hypothetical protein
MALLFLTIQKDEMKDFFYLYKVSFITRRADVFTFSASRGESLYFYFFSVSFTPRGPRSTHFHHFYFISPPQVQFDFTIPASVQCEVFAIESPSVQTGTKLSIRLHLSPKRVRQYPLINPLPSSDSWFWVWKLVFRFPCV